MTNYRRGWTAAGVVLVAGIAGVAAVQPAARADVKVVTKMSGGPVDGNGQPKKGEGGGSGTTTTYYRGNKIRTEGENGMGSHVTIMDGDSGKIYMIDPANKTYRVQSVKGNGPNMAGMMAALDIKTTADVTPIAKTRTIAGKVAHGYAYKATITMGMKPGAFGAPTGGPAGSHSPGGAPGGKPPLMGGFEMSGEQWVTDAYKMPGNGSAATFANQMGGPAMDSFPGLKPLMDKFAKIKGLSLASSQTIIGTGLFAMIGGGGMPPPGGPPKDGKPARSGIRVVSEAISISDGPLPASLFVVPAGYKEVAAPPMMPPRGRMGAMPGPPGGGPGASEGKP